MVFIDPGTDDNLNEHLCFLSSLKEMFFELDIRNQCNARYAKCIFLIFLKIYSAANYISLIMQFIVYCFYKYFLPSFVNLSNV